MPKLTDYKKAFIYKIECRDPTVKRKYYGSSTGEDRHRRTNHKQRCTNENDAGYNLPVYRFIRENGGWDNFVFIRICDYPCANKEELQIKEQSYISLDENCLNCHKAYQTDEERDEQIKLFNDKNNAIMTTCECGHKYRSCNKKYHNEKSKIHQNYLKSLTFPEIIVVN